MARALLIAEKPSLMREIQAVYKTMSMKDTIDFAAFAGHLMTLCEPGDYEEKWGDKKWNWDMLPIVPDNFKCKISKGKEKLYNDIKYKLQHGEYDYIINACDPDREGNAIFWYFYSHLGTKLPYKRFWTNDLTESSIEKALLNLRDSDEPFLANLTEASKLRGQFDWLVGMNITVASTLKMGATARIGRVKTPTLKILVDRELEILNFKPTTTYELEGIFNGYSGTYFDEEGIVRFKDKKDADKIIKDLSKDCFIESIEKKTESQAAPQLYSLSTLQTDASKTFGYGAEQTKSIVQSLYEKKILSYPRTDNPCISSALAKEFDKMLKAIAVIDDLKGYATTYIGNKKEQDKVAKNKKYVNDAKMAESGHYAIIPTGNIPKLSALDKEELNIFTLVCKRLLAIFMPPLKVSKTVIVTNSNDYLFKTNGKVLLDKGFTVLYDTKSTDVLLPSLKKGDKVELKETKLNEKISTPPQRYTDGTLITAMENPAKFLQDEGYKSTLKESKGIGTPATRDNIIGELVKNGYIEKKKGKGKVEYIYATPLGISIIDNVRDKDISSVDLTGIWEDNLSKIEKGEMKSSEFKKEMINYVLKTIDDIKGSAMNRVYSGSKGIAEKIIGACPKCGKPFKEAKDFYLCSDYKKSCDVIISKNILGAKVTVTEVKKIIGGKPSKEMSFKKGDKEWKSTLVYNAEQGKVVFGFADKKSDDTSNKGANTTTKIIGECPKCGKLLKATEKYYLCEQYKSGCDFLLSKNFTGANITETDMKNLLSGKQIKKTFTWKSGKSSEAGLALEKGKPTFKF